MVRSTNDNGLRKVSDANGPGSMVFILAGHDDIAPVDAKQIGQAPQLRY
jgi:hypothetical protein